MDFTLTREQEMVKKMAREFAEREIAPRAAMLDEKREFPQDIVPKMAKQGLIGISSPKEYGGGGMSPIARLLATEEIARVYPPLAWLYSTNEEVILVFQMVANEEQKKRYLVPLVKGEKTSCFAVTEPSGGSNPTVMATIGKPVDDGYIINGRKVFITNGGRADICIFVAKTGEKSTLFVVDNHTPGYEIGRRENISGLRAVFINELIFNNCRIPRANILGEEGAGLAIALTDFNLLARPGVTTIALGIARGAHEAALKFAKERKLYGAPIAELQSIQFALADMDIEIEAAKWLHYYCLWLIDQNKSSRELTKHVARAKAFVTEVATKVCLKAIQIMGGYGTTTEYGVVRRLHDALACIPGGGTSEIMKVTIARELLR